MNKKILLIVLVLLLIATGVYLFAINNKFGLANTSITQSNSPKTLKEIFGLGIAQKCTYDKGTIYVADGKMRGDFSSIDEGVTTNGHTIVDGNTSYFWTEGETTGFKTTFNLDATPQAESRDTPVSSDIDPVQPENYVCEPWVVKSDVFTLPSSVEFKDLNSMIPTMAPYAGTSEQKQNGCSYCDMLSGDDKSQCLSAMKCE